MSPEVQTSHISVECKLVVGVDSLMLDGRYRHIKLVSDPLGRPGGNKLHKPVLIVEQDNVWKPLSHAYILAEN